MPGWSRSRRLEANRKRGGNAAFFCATARAFASIS
jgi:hypothetical protein